MSMKPTKRDPSCDAADETIDRLQARLDAIAAIVAKVEHGNAWFGPAPLPILRVLARGTPRWECERAVRKWSRKERR